MKRWLPIAFLVAALFIAGASWFALEDSDRREEVVITMPYTENIREIDTNYYKRWLEERTGLSIRFNVVREAHSADYLRSMFASGYVEADAFFSILDGEGFADWNDVIQGFGEKGYILPLNEYVEDSTHLNKIFGEFDGYDLRDAITSADGNMYYMPGFDPSVVESHYQVLWLNEGWLKTLGLKLPQTTEDLRTALEAFRDGDPNGNGLADEIPLAGSNDVETEKITNFLINAFVYNDPDNSRLYVEDGSVRFAPMTDEWREAMKYLNGLYADGLMEPFAYDHNVLAAIANDTWDVLGGFASQSVTDVLFLTNPELVNTFVHIAPLAGPEGVRNATVRTPLPRPMGVVTSSCDNPEAVFCLFDLMLSEEAFLIGRFGEEGVDWVPGRNTDTNFYGGNAAVKVINQIQNGVQNKHICEIGPFFAYPKYAESVTFSGFEVAQEYIDAGAYRAYEPFKPKEHIRALPSDYKVPAGLRHSIDQYTDVSIRAFVTGEANPFDDSAWRAHLQKYRELGVGQLLDAVTEEGS